MRNKYRNIRFFPQGERFAVMESESREAKILSTHDTLEQAIEKRDSKSLRLHIC